MGYKRKGIPKKWEAKLTERQRELVASMVDACWEAAHARTPLQYREDPLAVEITYFEALKSVFRSAQGFDEAMGCKFSTYSYGLIGKQAANVWKSRKTHRRVEDGRGYGGNPIRQKGEGGDFTGFMAFMTGPPADAIAERKDDIESAGRKVGSLLSWLDRTKPKSAMVVRMVYGLGNRKGPQTIAEIAARLRCHHGTVICLHNTGINQLRKRCSQLAIQCPV